MKPKYYRTVLTVEVLSQEPYDPETLAGVAHDIVDGDCSGDWEVTEPSKEVTPDEMEKLLEAQGSDPGFFGLGYGRCKRCGTPLDEEGYCADETCPHSDYLQDETWTEG